MTNSFDVEKQEAFSHINKMATRAIELTAARKMFPGMELSAAYKKFKESRGETPPQPLSSATKVRENEISAVAAQLKKRPCTASGCSGTQHLESVCTGCVEGKAGYKSKWTCNLCMHRDLSKDTVDEWMKNLSSL